MSGFGGILSFELAGGYEQARDFTRRLKLVRRAVSLGGTKTLAAHAASMVFPHLSSAERAAAGISENLVRLSVGIEEAADILEDLDAALRGSAAR
jgi:cystathionine beta-lyase/cystathionine gamma-synthase